MVLRPTSAASSWRPALTAARATDDQRGEDRQHQQQRRPPPPPEVEAEFEEVPAPAFTTGFLAHLLGQVMMRGDAHQPERGYTAGHAPKGLVLNRVL